MSERLQQIQINDQTCFSNISYKLYDIIYMICYISYVLRYAIDCREEHSFGMNMHESNTHYNLE